MNKIARMKIINSLKSVLTAISIVVSAFPVYPQSALPDGVSADQNYINTIVSNFIEEDMIPFDLNNISLSVSIPIQVHIIKNIQGFDMVNTSQIYQSVNTANEYFKPIGIHFYVDSVDYVEDYNYLNIMNDHNLRELLTKYAVSNKINLFLAEYVGLGNKGGYGYTYFPTAKDSNFIFLNKYYTSGKYLTTLLGHFMGLLSTHENFSGNSLANEKNCALSGDFICDTYADPDLNGLVDENCNYFGSAKDANGEYYIPSVANIMSNAPDKCKCIFTPLQYRRMYYYYLKYRQSLKK
jgi:hypothetical protein